MKREMKKEKDKKKGRVTRVAALLLLIALFTSFMLNGTLAKYTTTVSGTASARVAKFDVSAGGITSNEIDLFDTIYDTKDVADYTAAGIADTDVKLGTPAIIAPGTWGKFTLELENDSEVSVS